MVISKGMGRIIKGVHHEDGVHHEEGVQHEDGVHHVGNVPMKMEDGYCLIDSRIAMPIQAPAVINKMCVCYN